MRKCQSCNAVKNFDEFKNDSHANCLYCDKLKKKEYDKKYRQINKQRYQDYCKINRDRIAQSRRRWYLEHKDEKSAYTKQWYADNVERKHKINGRYVKHRRKRDPLFNLRSSVSRTIHKQLKAVHGEKIHESVIKYLPFSIQDFKQHLESQFESWMNWDNWGRYSKNWNDNDVSTWTWQIDHIIPQYKLPYSLLTDDNFKRCWSLSNLRPLKSKQNLLDGVSRAR